MKLWLGLALAAALAPMYGIAETLPDGFVRLSNYAPKISLDIRYARAFNFTGGPVPGYEAGECILTEPTAKALVQVEAALNTQGYALIVFDCYRPQRAVDFFADWAKAEEAEDFRPEGVLPALDTPPDTPNEKDVFFPALNRADLHRLGYIAARSGHSVGNTVDVGLRSLGYQPDPPVFASAGPCDGPFQSRARESDLDMGTAFDCFSPLSAYGASVPAGAGENRDLLRRTMKAMGFASYEQEWWHFRNSRDHATQVHDFPVE